MERALLATLHHAPRLRKRGAAVLLCNPFGEEAVRAHRIYRVLANQLERSGYAALRFDYYATGDSQGDSTEASVARWLEDIDLAAEELKRLSGVSRVVLVGLRLGATLAALTTARGTLRARQLVLWDPVVDGSDYLAELGVMHRSYMDEEMAGLSWGAEFATDEAGVPSESLGTPILPGFAAEMRGLRLDPREVDADRVTVISTRESPAVAEFRNLLGAVPGAKWIDIPSSVAWNSDAAVNNVTVPMDIIQSIVASIEELSP